MIWVLTAATFVITSLACVMVFVLYPHRDRLGGLLSKTPPLRREPRNSARIDVEVAGMDGSSMRETVVTKNVSTHGICALTQKQWQPDNDVNVRFLVRDVRSHARIAYCKPLKDAFVVGFQFSEPIPAALVSQRIFQK